MYGDDNREFICTYFLSDRGYTAEVSGIHICMPEEDLDPDYVFGQGDYSDASPNAVVY